jgi:hypothetical protein
VVLLREPLWPWWLRFPRIERLRRVREESGATVRTIKLIYRAVVDLMERSRTGRAALAAIRATTHSIGSVLHQLWLEVTGFTFLAMAGVGAMAGIREYGRFQSGHATGPGRLLLAICFTVTFAWFGLSSFWRVRRKAKS